MFTVHTRPQWQRRLLFDGVNVQKAWLWWRYYGSQPWCIWKQYSLQTHIWVAHQGRWQWVMLWSWWTAVLQHVSQTFLYNLYNGRRSRRKSKLSPETLRLPAEGNFGPFTQHAWEWQMLCLLRIKHRKCMLLRYTLSNIFDKHQADYGVALHKQLNISSTACKVKVAKWTLLCLSQLRHFTLVKVSISF